MRGRRAAKAVPTGARSSPCIAIAMLAALALSGCGGGGGGEGPVTTRPAERPVGGDLAKASAMHDRGGTGAGQVVGVVDSGASTHSDLSGKFAYVDAMGYRTALDIHGQEINDPIQEFDGQPVTFGWGEFLDDASDGHGTLVNGIVAAERNGRGVYGVAYDARIASYGTTGSIFAPWGNGFDPTDGHQWGALFDQELAHGIDLMLSRNVLVTNFSWHRTGPYDSNFDAQIRAIVEALFTTSDSLAAFRNYVSAGGVLVWATGNDSASNPSIESVLPYYFTGLENGWLAVTAVDSAGAIASYANRCGIAADWCLAAPGTATTTSVDGGYRQASGTSFSAPYVAASLAALKSLFTSLSYQELRERILTTANKQGIYADTTIYGQGMLDLDAASQPVGGLSFSLSAHDSGPMVSTTGTSVFLPQAAIETYFAGHSLLVFDGYQRAPFPVEWQSFAGPRQAYLSLDDLALAPQGALREERNGRGGLALSGDDIRAGGLRENGSSIVVGQGARVMQGLAQASDGALPNNDYRMSKDATGVALGFDGEAGTYHVSAAAGAAEAGSLGFGVAGWSPEAVLAASFTPDGAGDAPAADAFGLSLASGLERPMGWEGAGALALGGDSVELAWGRSLATSKSARLDMVNRLTHLAPRSGPLMRFDDALVSSVDLNASFRPIPSVTVGASAGVERSVSGAAGRIHSAASVDEEGRIAYRDIAIDGRDLLSFDKAAVRVGYSADPDTQVGLGIMAVRDGFGRTETLAGVHVGLAF